MSNGDIYYSSYIRILQNPSNIQYVEPCIIKQYPELVTVAFAQNSHVLNTIKQMPPHLGVIVLKRDINNIKYIKKPFVTGEMCDLLLDAAENLMRRFPSSHPNVTLKYLGRIPPIHKTPERCERIICISAELIKEIPRVKRNKKICAVIFAHNVRYIKHFPVENITQEYCDIAVNEIPYLIKKVPEKFQNDEMYEKIIKKDGLNLRLIPFAKRTSFLCLRAFLRNPQSYVYANTYNITDLYTFNYFMNKGVFNSLEHFPLFNTYEYCCKYARYLIKNFVKREFLTLDFYFNSCLCLDDKFFEKHIGKLIKYPEERNTLNPELYNSTTYEALTVANGSLSLKTLCYIECLKLKIPIPDKVQHYVKN